MKKIIIYQDQNDNSKFESTGYDASEITLLLTQFLSLHTSFLNEKYKKTVTDMNTTIYFSSNNNEKLLFKLYKVSTVEEILIIRMAVSNRTIKSLHDKGGINTVGELIQYSEKELLKFYWFGLKSLEEVKYELNQLNLMFNTNLKLKG